MPFQNLILVAENEAKFYKVKVSLFLFKLKQYKKQIFIFGVACVRFTHRQRIIKWKIMTKNKQYYKITWLGKSFRLKLVLVIAQSALSFNVLYSNCHLAHPKANIKVSCKNIRKLTQQKFKELKQASGKRKQNQIYTRQVSSLIHSARPTVSPVENIVFALFCFARFWKVWWWTDVQWFLPVVSVGWPSGSI